MDLNEYQKLASRTLPERGAQHFFISEDSKIDSFATQIDIIHALFGLMGEVGELTDPVKRAMFYGKELDIRNVKEEVGDLLWYVAGPLCRALGCTLEELAVANIEKLKQRYPNKYTDQDALERKDKLNDPYQEFYRKN